MPRVRLEGEGPCAACCCCCCTLLPLVRGCFCSCSEVPAGLLPSFRRVARALGRCPPCRLAAPRFPRPAGQTFLVHTKLEGATTLRLAIGSTNTQVQHVREAWAVIQRALDGLQH